MTGDTANTDSKTTGMNWDFVGQPGYMATEAEGAREDRARTVSVESPTYRWKNTVWMGWPSWVRRTRERDDQAETARIEGAGRAGGPSERAEISDQRRDKESGGGRIPEVNRGKKFKGEARKERQ